MQHNPLAQIDYRVDCDDFLLYELGRLIEEDRASLEIDDFRRLIEEGIHEHVERRLDVRAAMAMRLRAKGEKTGRVLRAIENIETPLRDLLPVMHSYTAYLFERLEQCAEIEPDERITTAADVLLESPEERDLAEPAIDLLGSSRSAVSARILAHAISEPMLAEDLEVKAYEFLRRLWPLPRHYILYSLKPHNHEDIPFRWFQLLIDCDEPAAVDRILEEVLVHAANADYREDLLALIQLLAQARDPETEDRVLQVLNSEHTPKAAAEMLEGFLKESSGKKTGRANETGPWSGLERAYATNRKYLAAARLFDAGRKMEAAKAIEDLLEEDPQYPFALMLKRLI